MAGGEPNQPRCPKASIRPTGESVVPYWVAVAPKAHTLEDVLDPSYLVERLRGITPGAVVSIHHEGHEYFVEMLVVGVDRDAEALAVKPLRVLDLREIEVLASDWSNATVTDEGARGWCVRLGNRITRTSFPTQAEARAFLDAKQTLARAGKSST